MKDIDNACVDIEEKSVWTEEARKKLKNAYIMMTGMLLLSAISAWASIPLGLVKNYSFASELILGLIVPIALIFAIERYQHSVKGLILSAIFSIVLGVSTSTFLSYYAAINPTSILIAFIGASAIFISLTIYAVTTKKCFIGYAGLALIILVALIVLSLLGYLFHISFIAIMIPYAIISVMMLYIIIDTQRAAYEPESSYISLSLGMYISFLNLFRSLLMIINE